MRNLLCALLWGCSILSAQLLAAREWADASGMFNIEAEFVAVREGKVILRKKDGKFLSIPIEKLSAADQKHLQSLASPAKPEVNPFLPRPESPTTPSASGVAIAQQAHAVLKSACHRCHGEDGTSEGGFNFALNLSKLAKAFVSAKDPQASKLYRRLTASDDTVMPPPGEPPRLSAAEIAIIKTWIEAGAPALADETPRELISNNLVSKWIAADMQAADERSRRFLRYFTLTHLHNAGVSKDELRTYRVAFAKLLNSLSWNTTLVVPEAIDPDETIFRLDLRGLNWTVAMWEGIERANPYFLDISTPASISSRELGQCKMPHVRIDWFVSVSSKPPLYNVLLALPETAAELETLLRVDAAANIAQEQVVRAAFNRSGVSQNNRLIEWHKSAYGSYWKSYDFAGNTGRQNLFDYPLGPGRSSEMFQHDGGELIFSLPNGMQGYMLVDRLGNRIDQGPTAIVSDPKRPDRTVTNGVSCMSCHYAGVIPKADEVGPAVRANSKVYDDAKEILALYRDPAELNRIYEEDTKRFAGAMRKLGVNSLSRSGEPVSAMAARFEQELDLPMVAAEFGLSVDDFCKRLDASPTMARKFAALRTPGGVTKREVFAITFGEATIELKLSLEGKITLGSRPQTPPPSVTPVPSVTPLPTPAPSRPPPTRPAPAIASATPTPRSRPARTPKPSVDEDVDDRTNEVARFEDITWGVHSLAFSPNGNLLAVGKPDREIRVFDVPNKTQASVANKLEELSSIESCAFTPDGNRLLAGGQKGLVSIFAVGKDGSLSETGQFAGHSQEVSCIAVSTDGKLALSGSGEKKARLWDTERQKEIGVVAGFEGRVKAVHISPTGNLGYATDGNKLLTIDLANYAKVTKTRMLSDSWAAGQSAAISPDGKLVAAGDSHAIRQWELGTGNELPRIETGEIQWSMVYAPDGRKLLSGSSGKVRIWNARTQKELRTQQIQRFTYIKNIAVAPDGKQAAVGTLNQVRVFRLPD